MLRADVLGAILAGGRSTRMGADKSLLEVKGLPLISHVARVMTSIFRDVVVVSDSPEKYRFLELEVIPDTYKGAGPLGGIHAALNHSTTDAAFISSCDTPLVSRAFIEYILATNASSKASIPLHDGILQPLCGLYHTSLLPIVTKNLQSGKFKVTDFLQEIDFSTVEVNRGLSFYSPNLFYNVNDAEDLLQLHDLLAHSSSCSTDCTK
jgi:molybdopterin-guanine dinucleotide biosynthesis protein A